MSKDNDLDLEMDDIAGEVSVSEKKPEDTLFLTEDMLEEWPGDERPPTEEEIEALEYQKTVERLEKHCAKTWIAVPTVVDDQACFESRELETCSGEFFLRWIEHVFPPSKESKHTAKSYETRKVRERCFADIISFNKRMEMKNPGL